MKKGWKIFWIVCASCVGIGFVCCAVSLMLGVTLETIEEHFPGGIRFGNGVGIFWHDDDWDEGPDMAVVEGNNRQTFTGVNSIDAEMWAGKVEVRMVSENSGDITVETENLSEKIGLKCYMDGDELVFRTKKRVTGLKNGGGTIYINIPSDYYFEEVSVEMGAGSLYVENIAAQQFSVEVGAGEALIDNFTAQEVDFDCGVGKITASGEARAEVDINCGVGEVTFVAAGCQSDYNYTIECGIGEVTCGESSYSGIGTEKKIYNNASREMDIECGIGEVTISFAEDSDSYPAGGMHHDETYREETHHEDTHHTEE